MHALMKEKGDIKMRQTIPMLILIILWTVTGVVAQPQHGGEKPRPWHDGGPVPFGPGGHGPGGPGGPGAHGSRRRLCGEDKTSRVGGG